MQRCGAQAAVAADAEGADMMRALAAPGLQVHPPCQAAHGTRPARQVQAPAKGTNTLDGPLLEPADRGIQFAQAPGFRLANRREENDLLLSEPALDGQR